MTSDTALANRSAATLDDDINGRYRLIRKIGLSLTVNAVVHRQNIEHVPDFLDLAVELDARIGEVARGGLQRRGLHPTGIVGAFGCAGAAAWLKGLTQSVFCDALGITLSMASGSMEFLADGAWTKRMHPGWAAVADACREKISN